MKAGSVEYKMPKAMADMIVKNSKSKKNPQEILVKYVNDEYGLLRQCVRVITY